jgi:hypothetical protein
MEGCHLFMSVTGLVFLGAGIFIGALLSGDPRHAEARPMMLRTGECFNRMALQLREHLQSCPVKNSCDRPDFTPISCATAIAQMQKRLGLNSNQVDE